MTPAWLAGHHPRLLLGVHKEQLARGPRIALHGDLKRSAVRFAHQGLETMLKVMETGETSDETSEAMLQVMLNNGYCMDTSGE